MAVGKKPKLANADEAVWGDMLHVTPQELRCRESHEALLVSVRVVFPTECDLFPIKRNEPVIAHGNAMEVVSQTAQQGWYGRRSAKGPATGVPRATFPR